MVRIAAGEQEAYDNFIEWLLESEAQEAYEEYVERKQREYGILAEKKKARRIKPDNRVRRILTPQERETVKRLQKNGRRTLLKAYKFDNKESQNVEIYLKKRGKVWCYPLKRCIMVDSLLFTHLKKHGEGESSNRKSLAKCFVNCLRYPQEVWKQTTSNRYVFLKNFLIGDENDRKECVIVVITSPDYRVITFYPIANAPDELGEKRWGELVYEAGE